MDNKTFTNRLAKQMGCDPKTATDLIGAFAAVLRDCGASLDTVAIPGFGNFVSMKKAERVKTDPQTGKRMLMPPSITMDFVAASKLNKLLTNE